MDVVLRHVINAMHGNRQYYKATEIGLELLVKLAKRCLPVRQWLYVNRYAACVFKRNLLHPMTSHSLD